MSSEKRPPCNTRYLEPMSVAKGNAEKLSENSLNTLVLVSIKNIEFNGEKRRTVHCI